MFQITLFGTPNIVLNEVWNVIGQSQHGFKFLQIVAFKERVQLLIDDDALTEYVRQRMTDLGYTLEIR